MSLLQPLLLGSIAASTVFLTLPFARLKRHSERSRSLLTMLAAGVLLFLFFEVTATAVEPIEEAIRGSGDETIDEALLLFPFLLGGIAIGALGIPAFEARQRLRVSGSDEVIPLHRIAMMIAVGLGLQNLTEGLANGQSAGLRHIGFAVILIIGFAIQNSTEGFGATGPLIGTRPSWRFLALIGAVIAIPELLGVVVGYSFVSAPLTTFFLALAAGVIMYELGELYHVGSRPGMKMIAMTGVLAGFFLGLTAEFISELLSKFVGVNV